jgi:hypothetical protein
MNIATETVVPATLGAAFAGGFYAGRFRIGEDLFALIVAPKASGERDDVRWNKSVRQVDGAASFFDGLANTQAMAGAGSAIAAWALALRIGEFADWYLPSRDELELLYRNLKPAAGENWVYRHGENPSSLPPGYPYTAASPGQTDAQAFRTGGPEAFEGTWYWTSTQYASDSAYAWCQYFDNGYQYYDLKDYELRARAVRRLVI